MSLFALLRFSVRDARGGIARLLFFAAAVVLAVSAMVSARLLRSCLLSELDHRAKVLLGADLSLSSRGDKREQMLESTKNIRGSHASETRFRSVLLADGTNGAKLVQVRIVDGPFPLYGKVLTEPTSAWNELTAGQKKGIILDRRFAEQLNLRPGSMLQLAGQRLPVLGVIIEGMSEISGRAFFAPRVYVTKGSISESFFSKKGSVVDFLLHLKFENGHDLSHFIESERDRLSKLDIEMTTFERRKEMLSGVAESVGNFFSVVGLSALFLGALGAGTALSLYLGGRTQTVALLRAMGATQTQVFFIFLVQIVLVGAIAAFAGASSGVLGNQIALSLLGSVIGTGVTAAQSTLEVLLGAALGLLALLGVSAPALFSLTATSPLEVLRQGRETLFTLRAALLLFAFGAIFIVVAALLLFTSVKIALVTSIGLIGSVALVLLAAVALRTLARWFFLRIRSFPLRFGIVSLYRPENQTSIVVLALSLVLVLVNVVIIAEGLVAAQVAVARDGLRPNLFLFDIQTDQLGPLRELLSQNKLSILQESPVVLMRLVEVQGRAAADILADSESKIPAWTLKRDYWTTYRAEQTDNETVLEGQWVGRVSTEVSPIPISVEDGLMEKLGVKVGDRLTWELQGMMMPTIISSKRDILWERLSRNSFIVFPEGVLESVPQTRFWAVRSEDEKKVAGFLKQLNLLFPNISMIDIETIVQGVLRIVAEIAAGVKFLSVFVMGTGLLVLLGALLGSAGARSREIGLLRTLGASRMTLIAAVCAEYCAMAMMAVVVAVPLSLVAGWALSHYLFKIPLVIPTIAIVYTSLFTLLATALLGQFSQRFSNYSLSRTL